MRALSILVSLLLAVLLTSTSSVRGKEPKGADAVRDGSTQERAIINDQPVSIHEQWEYRYLDKQFPGRKPLDHRFAADAATRRVWSVFTFMWHGRKATIWFDITKPFRQYAGSTREFREFAKPSPKSR